MIYFISLCFLSFQFTLSQQIYEFKRISSTIALYMKSDTFINSIEKNLLYYYYNPNGFYIGNLALKNTKDIYYTGYLTIIVKNNNDTFTKEENITVPCDIRDLSSKNRGMALFCLNVIEFDTIELSPHENDTIIIEGYEKIKFTETETDDEGAIMKIDKKNIALFLIFLLL